MAEITGVSNVIATLRGKLARMLPGGKQPSAVVGYTQAYALHVHEDLEASHKVGQAKYLEQPARQLANDGTLGRVVTQAALQGLPLAQCLLLAALRIQRESQPLVPVDTGALRASAFTKLEG